MDQDPQTADDIRRRMDTIRARLGGEVDGIVSNAQQLTDWRFYVRTFPWSSLGVALALGYLAVPRKQELVGPDAETLEKLAKDNRLVVQHIPQAEAKRGLLVSSGMLIGNLLLKAGIAYLGQQLPKVLREQAAKNTPQTEGEPHEMYNA